MTGAGVAVACVAAVDAKGGCAAVVVVVGMAPVMGAEPAAAVATGVVAAAAVVASEVAGVVVGEASGVAAGDAWTVPATRKRQSPGTDPTNDDTKVEPIVRAMTSMPKAHKAATRKYHG